MTAAPGDRCEVPTSLGPLWFYGRPSGRPTLLVITGIGAQASVMDHLPPLLPDLDVLRMHLPGNHSPRLAESSVEAFSLGLNEALQQVVTAPLAIMGLSAGGLVAMGVRHPGLASLLLLDPPFRTTGASPLKAPELVAFDPEMFAALLDRDFSHLIDELTVPTEVLAGSLGAVERDGRPPTLVDQAARERLAEHPLVTLTVVPGLGHLVQRDREAFVQSFARLLQRLRAVAT